MAIYGYARVSKKEQNLDRQILALEEAGCEYIYSEKITGTKKDRPELENLLNIIGKGDIVYVCELTRVSRSTQDLIDIVNRIAATGADIKSIKESWLDTTTAQGKLMFTIMAGLAQFERDLLVERVKDGLETAKKKGVTLGRPAANTNKVDHAIELYKTGLYTSTQITDICDISKSTLYRALRKHGLVRN
ncbi:helix-turn-helix domain-containing protein [Clostridium perfringens]